MQKTFTFSKFWRELFPKDYRAVGYFTLEDVVRARVLKKGYVLKDLKKREMIEITCTIARANVPMKEREKFQEKIDKMPTDKIVFKFPKK